MKSELMRVLIVVHPGSCCGSATSNLGRYDARSCRAGLIAELDNWTGAVAVIDGELSDELPDYPVLNQSLLSALARNHQAGFPTIRIQGDAADDFDQVHAANAIIQQLSLTPSTHTVKLTGAWTHGEENDDGCVDDVYRAVADAGISADILDSAFALFVEELEEGEIDDEEPIAA